MARVIVGVDPHKRSATIEVIDAPVSRLSDRAGSAPIVTTTRRCWLSRQHTNRVWAVEGCNGIGRHVAQRLVRRW
jgi:hypothetical protein